MRRKLNLPKEQMILKNRTEEQWTNSKNPGKEDREWGHTTILTILQIINVINLPQSSSREQWQLLGDPIVHMT